MWKLSNSWGNPSSPTSRAQGFAPVGSGAQYSGAPGGSPALIAREPVRPTKGLLSWLRPAAGAGPQRGFPAPENARQRRPAGSMPNDPPIFGGPIAVETPYFSRGADAFVQNFGKVFTNPIGAGIVALHRPQASYGEAGQYANGAIFWASQVIPTTINLQGLTDPEALAEIVGNINVQAMVRTTG